MNHLFLSVLFGMLLSCGAKTNVHDSRRTLSHNINSANSQDGDLEPSYNFAGQIMISNGSPVGAVHYKVVGEGESCSDAAIAEKTEPLIEGYLPEWLTDGMPDGDYMFADAFFTLDEGTYQVCVTALSDVNEPALQNCSQPSFSIDVFPEATNEVMVSINCSRENRGAIDIIAAVNHGPLIENLEISPSKFTSTCEDVHLHITASDPEQEKLDIEWQVGAELGTVVIDDPENCNEVVYQPKTSGTHFLTVKVTDDQGLMSRLEFPIHVRQGSCEEPEPLPGSHRLVEAMIAYEDLIPTGGDFDYNDFVAKLEIREDYNSDGYLAKATIDITPMAKGAGYDHELLLDLDGTISDSSNISKVTDPLIVGNSSVEIITTSDETTSTTLSGQGQDHISIISSTDELFSVSMANVYDDTPYEASSSTYRIIIIPEDPTSQHMSGSVIPLDKYRFVLRVKNTGKDVDLFSVNSDAEMLSSEGQPFGILVHADWKWPLERVAVTDAYPDFDSFVDANILEFNLMLDSTWILNYEEDMVFQMVP